MLMKNIIIIMLKTEKWNIDEDVIINSIFFLNILLFVLNLYIIIINLRIQ